MKEFRVEADGWRGIVTRVLETAEEIGSILWAVSVASHNTDSGILLVDRSYQGSVTFPKFRRASRREFHDVSSAVNGNRRDGPKDGFRVVGCGLA